MILKNYALSSFSLIRIKKINFAASHIDHFGKLSGSEKSPLEIDNEQCSIPQPS